MDALRADLDLREPLEIVQRDGAAFVEQTLTEPFRRRLQGEIEGLPFETLPVQMGPVQTETDVFVISNDSVAHATLIELREELLTLVHQQDATIEGLAEWYPNEIFVQRYLPASRGISPHLDSKRFRVLIAIFTTQGSSPFIICKDRSGKPLTQWPTQPGSLTLLRGPGLGGMANGRPMHTVDGPITGTRFSVTFRMNSL